MDFFQYRAYNIKYVKKMMKGMITMKKELYGITREDAFDKNSYTLEYYLTQQEIFCDGAKHNTYGVEIHKLIPSNGSTIEEISCICDLTTLRSKIEYYLRLLTDCKVTPTHLKDITLDFLNGDEPMFTPKVQSYSA